MDDIRYKEYTEEENAIYNDAMDRIMAALKDGKKFDDACSAVHVENKELKRYIEDDALKIMIADMHFIKGCSLEEVADTLVVSIEAINRANAEMMQDIETTAIEAYKTANPDSPVGSA
jgi:hypothetical protein